MPPGELEMKNLRPNVLFEPEVESLRTSLASRTSSRTYFEVLNLGLEGQVFGLGLEASSPRKLPCPRLKDSSTFKPLTFCWKTTETLRKICEDLFWFSSIEDCLKKNFEDLFFWENTCACVLCTWPWSRAFLSLASGGSVLEGAVLTSDFFVSLASSFVSSTLPLI